MVTNLTPAAHPVRKALRRQGVVFKDFKTSKACQAVAAFKEAGSVITRKAVVFQGEERAATAR